MDAAPPSGDYSRHPVPAKYLAMKSIANATPAQDAAATRHRRPRFDRADRKIGGSRTALVRAGPSFPTCSGVKPRLRYLPGVPTAPKDATPPFGLAFPRKLHA